MTRCAAYLRANVEVSDSGKKYDQGEESAAARAESGNSENKPVIQLRPFPLSNTLLITSQPECTDRS